MRFAKFIVIFISIYFFFIKAAKGAKEKEYWIAIMKIIFYAGIMMNIGLTINALCKKIVNEG